MASTDNLVSRIYAGFRGADFRGEEINLVRSPDCLNVWKDYKETDSIRTRPELELKVSFDNPVHGVFFYDGTMLVHSGTTLYKVKNSTKSVLYNGLNEITSNAFVYEGVWYFKDGKHYLQYDGKEIKSVEGYIPTTSIARNPKGGGKIHEDVNFLTGMRRNTFLRDGIEKNFSLDCRNIDSDFKPIVEIISGETGEYVPVTESYSVDYANGVILFNDVPANDKESLVPLTDGQDDMRITFRKTIEGYRDTILNCTMLQMFDNRVFFSGNPKYPNVVYHCSLNDPSYCSDLDYYREGMDDSPVRGMVAGNNALWVFREPSDANTNVFYHNPTIDDEYGKIYPSSHSSITTGCVGAAINFNDDICFFSERGMEGISGDITTEQAVAHRSTLVDRKMISEKDYKNMILEEWEGYLLVFIGNKVYLADSRTAFTNEDHIEYDWFYWEFDKAVLCARVNNGILYVGTEDGVYTLTDYESPVESYWVTPKDKFKHPHKLKTTNKRGCVAEATTGTPENNFVGEISVYAKIEDTEFELIGTYENVTDYFVSRIKRKKFKDIQLKFHSKTRFSLETVTLECFIGGYIKR